MGGAREADLCVPQAPDGCSMQDCYCECWEEGTGVLRVTSASLSQECVAVISSVFCFLVSEMPRGRGHMEVNNFDSWTTLM